MRTQAGDAAVERAHVDAIARDLDVMASATAIFFSPESSMALLGAALAPEDVTSSRWRFCPRPFVLFDLFSRDLRRRPRARSPRLRRERYPPDAIDAISRRRVPTQVRSHAKGWGVGAACQPTEEPAGRRRVYGVVAVVASELTQVTTF